MEEARQYSVVNRRLILVGGLGALAGPAAAVTRVSANEDGLYFHPAYDPARNPAADVARAAAIAARENRRVLLEVGGDWCVWCAVLDDYLATHADVRAAFRAAFLIVKVNYSRQNENEGFLSAYPDVGGYPAFIVLDAQGRYLASQDTADFERDGTYDRARMLAFAQRWRVRV